MVEAPPSRLCATGMKILPPERKLADWPLMAMMFGSASTRTRPSRFFVVAEQRGAARQRVQLRGCRRRGAAGHPRGAVRDGAAREGSG